LRTQLGYFVIEDEVNDISGVQIAVVCYSENEYFTIDNWQVPQPDMTDLEEMSIGI
jgi:hypothetical protein